MVSHSMSAITSFADRVLLLDRGAPVFLGKPMEAVEAYHQLEIAKQQSVARISRLPTPLRFESDAPGPEFVEGNWPDFGDFETLPGNENTADPPSKARRLLPAPSAGPVDPKTLPALARAAMHKFMHNEDAVADIEMVWFSEHGEPIDTFSGAEGAVARISFTSKRRIGRLVVGVPVWSALGALVTGFGSHGRFAPEQLEPGRHRFVLHVPALRLNHGVYYPVLAIQDGTEFLYRGPCAPMEVAISPAPLFWGLMTLDYHWEWESSAPAAEQEMRAARSAE
jgi:hypothetical protein